AYLRHSFGSHADFVYCLCSFHTGLNTNNTLRRMRWFIELSKATKVWDLNWNAKRSWPCFSQFDLLPPIIVNDIMEDQDGNIWLASQDQGVFCYDGKTIRNIAEKEGLGDNYAGGMAQDKEGNFWFTMKGGICRYDGQTFTSYTTKDGIGGSEIWGLCRAASGIIWITARGSTTRFDPAVPLSSPTAFTVFTEEDGLNCCVQSMYQDRAGNMWWGTGQGLYRFDGQRFYQVKQDGPW
ncbi:MAG: two-component regulator propeller domain-containing protein, partial [Bacteroidota bacterium]